MSIGNGGIIGKKNTVTGSVASGVFTINEQIKFIQVNSWPKVINVSVAPNITVVNEGGTVTFNVIADGIDDGTTLFFTTNTVSGTINTGDFASGTTSGSFTVSGGTGQIIRTIAIDATTPETGDSFSLSIRSGSTVGPILATSAVVTISNATFVIQTSATTISEGTLAATFSISSSGIDVGQTIFYELIGAGGTLNATDFTESISGTFTTSDNLTSLAFNARADQFTEGTESFFLRLRYINISGVILASSETINITDSSVNPTITFTQLTTNINEGVTNNITISASPVFASAVSLTYVAQVLSGSIPFSGSNTGTLSNFSSTGSFSITILTSGTGGTYRVDIIRDGVTIAQSATVTVNNVAAAPTTMTFVASATSSTTSITIPATAQVGDIAVLFDTPFNAAGGAITSFRNANFTLIKEDAIEPAPNSLRSIISYRVLTAGNPGSSVTVMTSPSPRSLILVFRPNNPITAPVVSTPVGQGTLAVPTTQTISMAGVQTPLIGFGLYRSSGNISPTRTSSLTMQEVQGFNTGIFAKYIIYNSGSTPQSGTISMNDFGSNILQSFFIRFT